MFEGMPYTNFHELNTDWIIKIAKDFLDQYTNIQQTITTGLEDLDTKAQQLQAALDAWYTEHSEDIANQLAQALEDLNTWYTTHEGYLDQYLADSITAFGIAADNKAAETIASIPADYTDFYNEFTKLDSDVVNLNTALFAPMYQDVLNWQTGYYDSITGAYDSWSRAICTKTPIKFYSDGIFVHAPADVYVRVYEYDENNNYLGFYGNFPNTKPFTKYIVIPCNENHKYHFVIATYASGTAGNYLTQEYINQIHICPIYNTDKDSFTGQIKQYATNWKIGYYKYIDGLYDTWTRAICTINPMLVSIDTMAKVVAPDDCAIQVTEYNMDGTFSQVYGSFNPNIEPDKNITKEVIFKMLANKYYHITCGLYANGAGPGKLNQQYINNIKVFTTLDEKYDIYSTGDNTDRTHEIENILNIKGVCSLGPGIFVTSGIQMPENSSIIGCGKVTDIRLSNTYDNELWTYGDLSFTQEQITVLNDTLPAGYYEFTADVTSDDIEHDNCLVTFYTGEPYVWSSSGSGRNSIKTGTNKKVIIHATKPFTAIGVYSSVNYTMSENVDATYNNISLKFIASAIITSNGNIIKDLSITGNDTDITVPNVCGSRNGIAYYGEGSGTPEKRVVIDNCFIHGFTGSGVDLNDTGYTSFGGVNMANCYVWNCYCGFHCINFSEFNRVTGCSFTACYIGMVNNGGNNQITGCNISSNEYGLVMDNSSGEHRNGTHGSCVGCIMQHNTTSTIYIHTEVSGWIFSSCNIDANEDGDNCIEIIDSTRIIFNACNFMAYFDAIITNGGLVLFNSCNFRSTLTDNRLHITNNNAVRFDACYTAAGTSVNPV